MTLQATLKGEAKLNFEGATGVTARIIRELTETGSDPRGCFEPASGGGWTYTLDYSHVTNYERDLIIRKMSDVA